MTAASELLQRVEIEPSRPARASVIWLHGLGADGHDFEPVVPALRLDPALAVRFILPHAPQIPVSINMGMRMPAWYDIRDLDIKSRHDPIGIARTRTQIEALIAREKERGIPAGKIALVGFSQGGAMALHIALRHDERLACAIGLSTYLVHADVLDAEASPANRDLPILMIHGEHDPMVGFDRGRASKDKLEQLGWNVAFKSYPMMHEVCMEEIADVAEFLSAALK